ncbi:hypothetical protein KM043_017888 [Ampulex compressa]|nr:hypothetical protein KM043_017888 [Ampulex compressa]
MSILDKDQLPSTVHHGFLVQEYLRNSLNESDKTSFHTPPLTSLTRVILVILLRVGFLLVQVGSVPVNNVNTILLQNAIDVCWSSVMYFLTGLMVAYNGDLCGLIGEGYWIGHPKVDKEEALIGWQAVAIASAISTTSIAGRTQAVGYLLIGLLTSALVQPLLVHWAWTSRGWMVKSQLSDKRVKFRDYAGSGVVHAAGGLSGLIGCLVLGRRILRLRDIDEASIATGSSGIAFAGHLLVLVGLQCLSIAHVYQTDSNLEHRSYSHIYVNNLLAASSCSLVVAALNFVLDGDALNHWTVMRCVQATVSGLVTVSAGADVYSPQAAIGLGCAGGVAFCLASRWIFNSALEDYCNIVSVHLVCGILGCLLAPICALEADILLNIAWQSICLFAILALVAVVMTIAFVLLAAFGFLRNASERVNHTRAISVVGGAPKRSFFRRLLHPDNESLYLEPGSISNADNRLSSDSRFWKYKKGIDGVLARKKAEGEPSVRIKEEEERVGISD